MLQIQPEKDIVIEFIKNEDFKYVRALGAYYLRLTGTSIDCYKYLEPLLNDYRKIREQQRDGNFVLSHMDEFIDSLLHEERVCDVQLPRIQRRMVLEENNDLETRISVLEDDLLDEASSSSDEEMPELPKSGKSRDRSRSYDRNRERRRHRSRSRSRERRRRSRSRSRERRRGRDRSPREHKAARRDRDKRDKEERGGGGGGGKDDLSISETNKLRASLGLPPLK